MTVDKRLFMNLAKYHIAR